MTLRLLYPTSQELARVESELKHFGKANFKNYYIIKSKIKKGWFMDIDGIAVADNVEELLLDLNDTQKSRDYDNNIK